MENRCLFSHLFFPLFVPAFLWDVARAYCMLALSPTQGKKKKKKNHGAISLHRNAIALWRSGFASFFLRALFLSSLATERAQIDKGKEKNPSRDWCTV